MRESRRENHLENGHVGWAIGRGFWGGASYVFWANILMYFYREIAGTIWALKGKQRTKLTREMAEFGILWASGDFERRKELVNPEEMHEIEPGNVEVWHSVTWVNLIFRNG